MGYEPVASDVHEAQSLAESNIGGHVAHVGPVHALRHLHPQPVLLFPDTFPLLLHISEVHLR